MKKLLTAKVAKESREEREESLGLRWTVLAARDASFSLRALRGLCGLRG